MGLAFLDGLSSDFRVSFRILLRHRMFAAACILTLALGIGSTTAVFSVVDATLLRPLPYAGADRLTMLSVYTTPSWNGDPTQLVWATERQIELLRWRQARSFSSIDGMSRASLRLAAAAIRK